MDGAEFHGCMMIDLAAYTVGATAESGQWWHEFLGLHAVWYDLLVGPLWILAGALLLALVASVSMVRLCQLLLPVNAAPHTCA